MGRQADVKGDDTGCGKQRQLFTAPVIIAETAVLIIPQIAVDRRPPIPAFWRKAVSVSRSPFRPERLAMVVSSLNRKAFRSMGINCVVRMLASRVISRSQRLE